MGEVKLDCEDLTANHREKNLSEKADRPKSVIEKILESIDDRTRAEPKDAEAFRIQLEMERGRMDFDDIFGKPKSA